MTSPQRPKVAAAGDDIDVYCGKCRLTLAHVVIASDTSRVVRAQCKTCRSEHGVRRTAPAKTKRATAAKPRTAAVKDGRSAAQRRAERAGEAAFASASAGRDLASAKRYRPSETFASGDVLDHATFGIGIIEKLRDDAKVQVIFEKAGERILVHMRS